ncbi:MAG: hypothetical protein RLY42_43, partial [Pseudomonadota bacterium]
IDIFKVVGASTSDFYRIHDFSLRNQLI